METKPVESKPYRLITLEDNFSGLFWFVAKVLGVFFNRFLGFNQLNEAYNKLQRDGLAESTPFFTRVKKVFGFSLEISGDDLERIPKTGPVVLVSNHPFGGLDGIAMGACLEKLRPGSKLLVNELLGKIKGIEERCFFVDPFGSKNSARKNLKGIKQSISWLRSGNLLATWPSGTVSHFILRKRKVTDPQWNENIVNIIEKTEATVVPVYFPGRNSLLFQFAGVIHPLLRTLLLPREMMKMRSDTIEIRIGNPISAKRLQHFKTNRDKVDFLRLRSYILSNRSVSDKTSFNSIEARRASEGIQVIPEINPELISAEITNLPKKQRLITQGEYSVYVAQSFQIPHTLREIGRLRELTFRKVGEGTGKELDLDEYDQYYQHLFMWNEEAREIVGAYRMGMSDMILSQLGKKGLYTTTLFRYRTALIKKLSPALELGRSFVVEKYQRKPVSLSLIWKGIGLFIVQNPQYKMLFGPVSISKEYESLSKNLIVMYLKENSLDPDYSKKVKAKNPPKNRSVGQLDKASFKRSVSTIDDVSALISEIEREEKGVPVLLKQYLRMNATLLSFNVDPEFNDCIDGLVLVDLSKADERTLSKYMGKTGAKSFLDYHKVKTPLVGV